MKYLVLLGRFFYSLIFLSSSFHHFSTQAIAYAASKGTPMSSVLVPFSGILPLLGGLSILLGYKARWGHGLLYYF